MLRRYRLLKEAGYGQAVGALGLVTSQPADVRQFDYAQGLGISHSWERHVAMPSIVGAIQQGLAFGVQRPNEYAEPEMVDPPAATQR